MTIVKKMKYLDERYKVKNRNKLLKYKVGKSELPEEYKGNKLGDLTYSLNNALNNAPNNILTNVQSNGQ